MKNENDKKGFFERLFESIKVGKASCSCGNCDIEDFPDESEICNDSKDSIKRLEIKQSNVCCGKIRK